MTTNTLQKHLDFPLTNSDLTLHKAELGFSLSGKERRKAIWFNSALQGAMLAAS